MKHACDQRYRIPIANISRDMFTYPLPSIPTHFQPILIENQSSPIGIDPKFEFSLRCYPPNDINEQDPHDDFVIRSNCPCFWSGLCLCLFGVGLGSRSRDQGLRQRLSRCRQHHRRSTPRRSIRRDHRRTCHCSWRLSLLQFLNDKGHSIRCSRYHPSSR